MDVVKPLSEHFDPEFDAALGVPLNTEYDEDEPGLDFMAQDASRPFTEREWDEAKVKRDASGKFSSTGGSKLTGISSIIRQALHPDTAKSEQTKKYLQTHHTKIDNALRHPDALNKLKGLKDALPKNNYNNKVHYYLEHLIKEHEEGQKQEEEPPVPPKQEDPPKPPAPPEPPPAPPETPKPPPAPPKREIDRIRDALHPDLAKSEQTKKYLEARLADIDKALQSDYAITELRKLQNQLPKNNYNNRVHAYMAALQKHLLETYLGEPPTEGPKGPPPEPPPAAPKKQPKLIQKGDPKNVPVFLHEMSAGQFQRDYGVNVAYKPHHTNKPDWRDDFAKQKVGEVRHAVAELPASHRRLIGKRSPVYVVPVVDLGGNKSTTGISGVGTAAGVFYSGSGRIEVGATYGAGDNQFKSYHMPRTLCHEVGHSLDQELGRPSDNKEFTDAIPPPGERGTWSEETNSKYFHLNTSETWAELYSVLYAPEGTQSFFHCMSRKRAASLYAKPLAVMKRLIEEGLAKRGITDE